MEGCSEEALSHFGGVRTPSPIRFFGNSREIARYGHDDLLTDAGGERELVAQGHPPSRVQPHHHVLVEPMARLIRGAEDNLNVRTAQRPVVVADGQIEPENPVLRRVPTIRTARPVPTLGAQLVAGVAHGLELAPTNQTRPAGTAISTRYQWLCTQAKICSRVLAPRFVLVRREPYEPLWRVRVCLSRPGLGGRRWRSPAEKVWQSRRVMVVVDVGLGVVSLLGALMVFALTAIAIKAVERRRLTRLTGIPPGPWRTPGSDLHLYHVQGPVRSWSDRIDRLLPVARLDTEAWAALCWRQEHLPLDRLRKRGDWDSLRHLEGQAARRVADRRGLSGEQRDSLIGRHLFEVERRAVVAAPEVVETMDQMLAEAFDRSRSGRFDTWWQRYMPAWWIGWPTWFSNRKAGLLSKMRAMRHEEFRLSVRGRYQDAPPLAR